MFMAMASPHPTPGRAPRMGCFRRGIAVGFLRERFPQQPPRGAARMGAPRSRVGGSRNPGGGGAGRRGGHHSHAAALLGRPGRRPGCAAVRPQPAHRRAGDRHPGGVARRLGLRGARSGGARRGSGVRRSGRRSACAGSATWPQAAAFAGALAIISLLGGRDAAAPGRVVNELIANGRVACLASGGPNAVPVPFVPASWLCGPGFPPRLVGKAPVGGVVYLAHRVELSGDLRHVGAGGRALHREERGALGGQPSAARAPAYLRALSVPASFRALALVLGALVSALTSVLFTFRRAPRHSLIAVAVGASGPLAALGMLRLLEQLPRGPAFALFLLVPAAAGAATALAGVILSRLRWSRRAGTS